MKLVLRRQIRRPLRESPPSRGAWIEIWMESEAGEAKGESPPSRGAWIEILGANATVMFQGVAPLAGGVD